MLSPKRIKFRKQHKGRIHGNAKGGSQLSFGSYGLKALTPERVTARQIEAARRAVTRAMKRAGQLWIRVFPDVPVSDKPAEVRMGKGKVGQFVLNPVVFCLKSRVLMKLQLAKALLWLLLNSRLKQNLLKN